MEENLQQHIAEFVPKLMRITTVDGVEHLVGFFEQVPAQWSLFALPRSDVLGGP